MAYSAEMKEVTVRTVVPESKKTVDQKSEEVTYTKREMTVYANPIAALAANVLWQWHIDGEPGGKDNEEVKEWWDIFYKAYKCGNTRR